jgi:hypothetical protein
LGKARKAEPKKFCERAQQSAKLQLGDSKMEKIVVPCVVPFSRKGYNITTDIPQFAPISPGAHKLNKVKVSRVFTRLSAAFPVLTRFFRFSSSRPKW